MQVNSTRACSTYVAVASPPSHCGAPPAGKKTAPQNSLVKKTKQNFPLHSGLECRCPLRHACPQWGGWSHCRRSGSATKLCSGGVYESQTGTVGGEGTKKKDIKTAFLIKSNISEIQSSQRTQHQHKQNLPLHPGPECRCPLRHACPQWGGWSHCRSSGSATKLCSGRVYESQTGTVGGEGTKKYNKFTHRLNVGMEHRQMHRRAPAPKQQQRVTKQARATL